LHRPAQDTTSKPHSSTPLGGDGNVYEIDFYCEFFSTHLMPPVCGTHADLPLLAHRQLLPLLLLPAP
jgi:hypothetical protein